MDNFPGRKAVKNMVAIDAIESKEIITNLFRQAITQGGFGTTLDLWTDKFKHNTYMAMTANFYHAGNDGIDHNRFVIFMDNVTDIVKSKGVIKSKIIEVFADFGVNENEIKSYIVFTTDRYIYLR